MAEPILYKPLGELFEAQDSAERPYKVVYSHNMGHRTFVIRLSLHDFYRMSDIAGEQGGDSQSRPLDTGHAQKLAHYMLKGLVHAAIMRKQKAGQPVPPAFIKVQQSLGSQAYLSLLPLVCNLRNCQRDGSDLRGRPLMITGASGLQEIAAHEVLLSPSHIFWVVDGQHRRRAMQLVFDFIEQVVGGHAYPGKKSPFPFFTSALSLDELQLWQECAELARTSCFVVAEIHLGLNAQEENQLYHDLNNMGRKVEAAQSLQFDRSNPVTLFVQEQLLGRVLHWPLLEKEPIDWSQDDGGIAMKDLLSINTRLLLNKTNAIGATPAEVAPRVAVALKFWESVQQIPFIGQPGARLHTVAAQPVMLKALAKLTFDFAFGRRIDAMHLQTLLAGIPYLDYSHDNPLWRYYQMDDRQREREQVAGLAAYVPDDSEQGEEYTRDIGAYDYKHRVMRFGPKHNDIYPILGDMVRWSLGLPTRQKIRESA